MNTIISWNITNSHPDHVNAKVVWNPKKYELCYGLFIEESQVSLDCISEMQTAVDIVFWDKAVPLWNSLEICNHTWNCL